MVEASRAAAGGLMNTETAARLTADNEAWLAEPISGGGWKHTRLDITVTPGQYVILTRMENQ